MRCCGDCVRRQWSEGGPETAVALLRDVYARLRAAPDGRLVVEPYGTLHVAWNSFELTTFLYNCESVAMDGSYVLTGAPGRVLGGHNQAGEVYAFAPFGTSLSPP